MKSTRSCLISRMRSLRPPAMRIERVLRRKISVDEPTPPKEMMKPKKADVLAS